MSRKNLTTKRCVKINFEVVVYINVTVDIYNLFQKELQNLEDAAEELMLADDDSAAIPYPLLPYLSHQTFLQSQNNIIVP